MSLQLDLVSTPSTCYGAFSACRVSTAYVGATVNVRRSSDNVTSDFYADAYGNMGTALNATGTLLAAWLGAATGYVPIWYDQSGKGNHATQTTAAMQPMIDTANFRVDFTAASGTAYLNLPSGTVPMNVAYTVTAKHNNINNTSGGWLGGGAATPATGNGNNFRRSTAGYYNYWWYNDFAGNGSTYAQGSVVTYKYDGSYSYLYVNGSPQGVSQIRSGWVGVAGNETIGRTNNGVGEAINGELYSLYVFKSALTNTDRRIVERAYIFPPTGIISMAQFACHLNVGTPVYLATGTENFVGKANASLANMSDFQGFSLRDGLVFRIVFGTYFGNDPTFFARTTASRTGISTNLMTTYSATGGFNNANFSNSSDFPVGAMAGSTYYSVEWVGYFYAPISGTYTFYVSSDDSSYIWLGANAVSGYTIANATIYNYFANAYEHSGTAALTAGQYYPVRIQYGDTGGQESICFCFAPPSGVRTYDGTGYYYSSGVLSGTAQYNFILNNNAVFQVQVQGTTASNPATSGYALYMSNPWLPNGYYWIKSAAMPTALQMYVDIMNGGYDFYPISSGISVNAPNVAHSGTPLGLDLMLPRSQNHWRAIYAYVHTVLASSYNTWVVFLPIYSSSTTIGTQNYSSGGANLAMFDPRYGNNGAYNGVPDWKVNDGGLWYLRDIPHSEPNGNYTYGYFLSSYGDTGYTTAYGAPGFDDNYNYFFTGANYLVSTNYAGSALSATYTYFDGSTSDRAAPSAVYIKSATGTATNGVYWINLPVVGPTQVYCIMDSAVNGGGWMMALKATTGTTFQFSSAHWTTATTLNPTDTTRNNADAKFNTFNYFQSKDILALWPDIPNTYGGSTTGGSLNLPTWGCWCWLKANYNAGTLQTLMSYFGTASNVSFATPTTTAIRFPEQGTAFTVEYYMNTNASTIASGNSFYGINFTSFATRNVRWGLAYNNESDWGSNDCGSGIGNSSATNNYSAGDEGAWIAANPISGVVGINRSARVEMYVR